MTDAELDGMLKAWASMPAEDAARHARIVERAGAVIDRAPVTRRWVAGSMGVAASLLLAMLTLRPAPAPVAAVDPVIAQPDAAFAALYTPTPLEEQML